MATRFKSVIALLAAVIVVATAACAGDPASDIEATIEAGIAATMVGEGIEKGVIEAGIAATMVGVAIEKGVAATMDARVNQERATETPEPTPTINAALEAVIAATRVAIVAAKSPGSKSITAMGGTAIGAGGNGCCDRVDHIRVNLTGAADVKSVRFNSTQVLVTYQDDANVSLMTFVDEGVAASPAGTANTCRTPTTTNRWYLVVRNQGAVANILEPGDVAEIYICTANLTPTLTTNSQFRIEVIPQEGAPIVIQRRTPLVLAPVMNLN